MVTDDPPPDFPADPPEQILDGLGEGVTLANRDGRIVFSNQAAERILGIPATDAPPEEWADYYGVFLPDDRTTPFPTDRYPLVRALNGETTRDVEMWIRNPGVPDGALISVTGRPLEDDDGRILGAAVVFRDITELRAAHDELAETNARLDEIRRQKDELAAFVVHDLKSPITGIMLSAELLLEQADVDDEDRKLVQEIHDAAGTLHGMVLDLLDIRLAEDGRLDPDLTPVRVQALLADVADTLRTTASGAGITLEVADDNPDLTISADPDLLRRVVQNLAVNCLKYTPDGRILLAVRPAEGDRVLITVEDEGPGVPDDLRDEIFQMWTLAERERVGRVRDSRGIGLYFSRLAVEAHGGRIWVEDIEPEGACFCVELPRAPGRSSVEGEHA